MASEIGKRLEHALVSNYAQCVCVVGWIRVNEARHLRYAVVGCCIVAAAILVFVSSNSNRDTDECRNWSARLITSLFTPCAAKAEVNEPFNIGAAPIAQQDDRSRP